MDPRPALALIPNRNWLFLAIVLLVIGLALAVLMIEPA